MVLALFLLNAGMSCLCKQRGSRSIWLLQKPTCLDQHCLSVCVWINIKSLDQVIWLAGGWGWAWRLDVFSVTGFNTAMLVGFKALMVLVKYLCYTLVRSLFYLEYTFISLQICDAANTVIRMWNLDSLPTTCQKLNHFHTSCRRNLLKVKWQDRIQDTVLKRTGCRVYILFWNWHRPCYQNAWWMFSKENPLWRTSSRKTLPWWSEEAIQGHPESLP